MTLNRENFYKCPQNDKIVLGVSGPVSLYAFCEYCDDTHKVRQRVFWKVRNDGQESWVSFIRG